MATKKKQSMIDSKQLGISVALALALGLGGGYLIGNAVGENHDHDEHSSEMAISDDKHMDDGHSHSDDSSHSHGDGEHSHDMFMVSAEQAPTVSLSVEKDEKSGYNVKISTTNFTFTPDAVNQEDVVGEGHAHLYVDGKKHRIYGPDFHYSGDIDGEAMFRVTLNSNMHGEYAVNGEVIEAMVTVNE